MVLSMIYNDLDIRYYNCEAIKWNESYVGNINFEIHPNIM